MLNAFYNPQDAVLDAKKLGDWVSTAAVMFISAVLIAAVPMIFFKAFLWKLSLITFGSVIGGLLVCGLFLKIALSALGAKNPSYFDTATSAVLGAAPFSAAFFASSFILMIPKAGMYLAMLVMAAGTIAMISAQIRAMKELTKTDMLTALIAFWIVSSAWAVIGYMAFTFSLLTAIMASAA